jgi:hypothetical protein
MKPDGFFVPAGTFRMPAIARRRDRRRPPRIAHMKFDLCRRLALML